MSKVPSYYLIKAGNKFYWVTASELAKIRNSQKSREKTLRKWTKTKRK